MSTASPQDDDDNESIAASSLAWGEAVLMLGFLLGLFFALLEDNL